MQNAQNEDDWSSFFLSNLNWPKLEKNALVLCSFEYTTVPWMPDSLQNVSHPHWAVDVQQYVDTKFKQGWIGRGGPIAWPEGPRLDSFRFLYMRLCENLYVFLFRYNLYFQRK